ncbi:MAG: DUF4126 domain-containing protein [Gemmatimonadota bacterium]
MPELPIEILALTPLALAAGVDLYLTLLLLGAAPTLGLWDTPLPGALGDLDPPAVLIMLGAFYVLEFAAERFAPTALAWNAFHAVIRPVSGALLALLLLEGQPVLTIVAGCALGGVLASASHAVRSGATVLRWLDDDEAPSVLLTSLAEDVAVAGIVSLTLDLPLAATVVTVLVMVVLSPFAPSYGRAFRYAIVLTVRRVFVVFGLRRWRGPDEMPAWVAESFADESGHPTGAALRGSAVGARHLPGAPRFAVGWLVILHERPFFVVRRGGSVRRIGLGELRPTGVRDAEFFRRVDLRGGEKPAFLLFDRGGPSAEVLRAEFPTMAE